MIPLNKIKSTMKKLSKVLLTIVCIIFIPFSTNSHEVTIDKMELIIKRFLEENPQLIKNSLEAYKKRLKKEKFQNSIIKLGKINNHSIYQKNATENGFWLIMDDDQRKAMFAKKKGNEYLIRTN